MTNPMPQHDDTVDQPEAGAGRIRSRIDPLSLAALTVVSLAIAIFVTLGIVTLFGTEADDAVDVEEALGEDNGSADAVAGALEVGSTVPDETLELLGGGSMSISELQGKPAVINFWSSTCAPCLAEMPEFERVHQDYGTRAGFLGIDVIDTVESGDEMVERTGVTYPNGRDPDGSVMAAFGGTALPRTVVVDAQGTVVSIHSGAMTYEELETSLREAGVS